MTLSDPFASLAPETHADWARRLRALAAMPLSGTPLDPGVAPTSDEDRLAWIDAFRDDAGNRRPVDRPLLCSMLGLRVTAPARCTLDVALWTDVANRTRDSLALLRADDGPLLVSTPLLASTGGGIGGEGGEAIEVWSEAELAALHALSHLARRDASLEGRVDSASRWLMENVQPDNATNRPWALHVFVDRWLRLGDVESHLYAQTLLHNCRVGGGKAGRVDRFSACLLEDSGRWLAGG